MQKSIYLFKQLIYVVYFALQHVLLQYSTRLKTVREKPIAYQSPAPFMQEIQHSYIYCPPNIEPLSWSLHFRPNRPDNVQSVNHRSLLLSYSIRFFSSSLGQDASWRIQSSSDLPSAFNVFNSDNNENSSGGRVEATPSLHYTTGHCSDAVVTDSGRPEALPSSVAKVTKVL